MLKAGVFNTYLGTWGGGERSTYATAAVLASMGFEVEVVTFEEHLPTLAEIGQFFGPGYTGFGLHRIEAPAAERDAALRSWLADKAVFVNHCAASSFVNPCPLGLYMVMFPFQPGGEWVRSYHHFLCNSEFTRSYTLERWGVRLSAETLYPAAGDAYAAAAERSKDILSIGRFNWRGHVKNHDAMVEAFAAMAEMMPSGWRLVLLGKLNALPENVESMEALKRRCRGLPIAFELNVAEQRKRELLSRASLYWHGTGVGRTEPQDMEHFGISVVEAMCAGVVPLCYHRGGPAEIVEHGKSGLLYRDVEELKTWTMALITSPRFREGMRQSAMQRAQTFGRAVFDRELAAFVRSVVAA